MPGFQTTYAGLKADLLEMTEDQSDNFLANLDVIIGLGETKCLRDLDLEIFQGEVPAGNLTVGQRTFARPVGLVKIRDIFLTTAGVRKWTPKRTKSYCEIWGEDPTVSERPTFWAEQDPNTLFFVNTPDIAYPVIAFGIARPAGLSDTNPTTWLSLYAADLLLYSCLVSSEIYLQNPDQVANWQSQYQSDQLPKAKLELRGMGRAEYELSRQGSTAATPL